MSEVDKTPTQPSSNERNPTERPIQDRLRDYAERMGGGASCALNDAAREGAHRIDELEGDLYDAMMDRNRLRSWLDYIGGLGAGCELEMREAARKAVSELEPAVETSAPFPYPTDRDGWICSVCHGWNVPKDRVCMHSHLPSALKASGDQHGEK